MDPKTVTFPNGKLILTPPDGLKSLGKALADNTPFPDDAFKAGAIAFGSIDVSAEKDIDLGGDVKFSASGSAFAGFGVYRKIGKLYRALRAEGLDEPIVSRLGLPEDPAKNLYALRWGYDASAGVNGKLALGPGVSFGASGQTEGFFAVLHSADRNRGARDAVLATASGWMLPRQVTEPGKLKPGTWVLAETGGEIKLSLGVEYGYEYSWVRESLDLGGLGGDVGLKIELGIKASLGFHASGRYAVVVSRADAREVLRLQVYRLKRNGWSFAFDAGVTAEPQQSIAPGNLDDFIRGVLNTEGLQALGDIYADFNKWTKPGNKLSDLLGQELVGYAYELVEEVTGFDPAEDLDPALDKLRDVVGKWHDLPHELSTVLYKLIRDEVPLDELTSFLKSIKSESEPGRIADRIKAEIVDVSFFETPTGKWLISAAEGGIMSALANIESDRQALVDMADKTLALLDGSAVEETFRKLQAAIEDRLGLDRILEITDKASFEQADAWLKRRLSDFLGKTIVVRDLNKIKKAINKVRDQAEGFYEMGYKAISRKYSAELSYAFEKSTTRDALLDITFDFAEDAASAGTHLAGALDGNFSEILRTRLPGVTLNEGVLTHRIKRRSHLEVDLPFFKNSLDHINESVAKGKVVDQGEDRLWVFTLKGQDVVRSRNSMSRLSIGMTIGRNVGLRTFREESYSYDYAFRFARREARRDHLEDRLAVLTEEYLPEKFGGDDRRSLSTYLTALDKALDSAGVAGDDNFGSTLVGLEVSVSGKALAAWKKVSGDKLDPRYLEISRRVQTMLREYIRRCYLQDLDNYRQTVAVYPLLVYSALPPINRAKMRGKTLEFNESDIYNWDYRSAKVLARMLEEHCQPRLPKVLRQAYRDLEGSSLIEDYRYANIGKMLRLKPKQAKENSRPSF